MYLVAVADGMGDIQMGSLQAGQYGGSIEGMMISLQNKIVEINRTIYQKYNCSRICGSTCTALLFYGEAYGTVSLGDSKIYLHRGYGTSRIM